MKEVSVFDLPLKVVAVGHRDIHWLDHMLVLVDRWLGSPVRVNNAVQTEVARVRFVAIVTAESNKGVARLIFFVQTLIDPIPDVATDQPRLTANQIPIVGQIAKRIPHPVRVFAHDNRPIPRG